MTVRLPHTLLLSCLIGIFLSGCGMSQAESAWQFMQEQQEQQAQMRRHEFDEARRQAQDTPAMLVRLIRENQQQGRYFAALAYINVHQARFGRTPELTALEAESLRRTGQIAPSTQAYQALLRTPLAAQGWHGLGLLAAGNGDLIQAIEHLERATGMEPANPEMLNDLGYARLAAGDPAGARLPLGQAAELAPDNPVFLSNMAILLLMQNDPAAASRLMDQAGLAEDTRQHIQDTATRLERMVNRPATIATVTPATAPAPLNTSLPDTVSGEPAQPSTPPQNTGLALGSLLERFSRPSP
ncbi:MAG: tetratricopeptide repeat protein [Corticimicrobacter sp.]|uniref:tetratricopeptide repeat protein n=1 Tax=Corticimicrobacter sp. TaxID=2678536 RepID=UPI0032DB51AF